MGCKIEDVEKFWVVSQDLPVLSDKFYVQPLEVNLEEVKSLHPGCKLVEYVNQPDLHQGM